MSTTTDTRRLNAIVGSAIRGLVESGADDEAVGSFAADHRGKVAQLLNIDLQAQDQAPDLIALVTQAVKSALEQSGIKTGKQPKRATAARINVEVRGTRTSLSLNRELLDSLIASRGGKKSEAKTVVQDLANAAPADVASRSGWVEQRIQSILSMSTTSSIEASRH